MAERAGRAGSRGIGPRPPQGEAPQGHRNPNPCPHYRKCGGCQLQNMTYPQQLIWKQRQVERLLGQYAPVQQILGMEHPYHYRNKVQAAFAYDRKRRRIISGVYQSSTHLLVPLDSCPIEDRMADAIIVTVRELLKAFGLTAYDELSGRGLLRHVLVKRGFSSGQVMVVLVTATPVFPSRNRFVEALCQRHPEITTVLQNVNPQFTSLVLGEREKVLYGPGFIEDTLCGLTFQISAKSFYQINPVQTEVLYGKAMEYAALTGRERVIDAYCGIGTIGLVAAKRAGQVLGVENNREAVGDAIQNARRNNIQNARFLCADAGEFCQELAQAGEQADVVFMDPPRAGSSRQFLESLARLAPRRVVYISCNPETQARDLAVLVKHGYRVKKLQPVDMFPHTSHVENIALLVRSIEGT